MVAATFVIMMIANGVYNAFGIFLKPVLIEFSWTRAITSGAFSLSMITFGLLGIVMGALNDRFGPRMVLSLCAFLLGLGYLLVSQVGAIWQLYLFYGVIIGAGMGGSWTPLLSTVARWFIERRGLMTGIVLTGMSAGTLIAPPIASWLVSTYDWRVAYIILGFVVLVVVTLAAQFLRLEPTHARQSPYNEARTKEQLPELATKGFSLRGALRTKQFWMVLIIFFCHGFRLFAIIIHIVPHAIDLGIAPASAANILATHGGLSIVGMVVMGSVADRIGNKQACIIGFALTAAALFWLVPATEAWKLYLFAGAFGFGQAGSSVTQSPIVAELFGLRSIGLTLGIVSLAFTIGGAVGPFLTGYIFDISGSYQVAFLVSAAISIIGLILTALLTPTKKRARSSRLFIG